MIGGLVRSFNDERTPRHTEVWLSKPAQRVCGDDLCVRHSALRPVRPAACIGLPYAAVATDEVLAKPVAAAKWHALESRVPEGAPLRHTDCPRQIARTDVPKPERHDTASRVVPHQRVEGHRRPRRLLSGPLALFRVL